MIFFLGTWKIFLGDLEDDLFGRTGKIFSGDLKYDVFWRTWNIFLEDDLFFEDFEDFFGRLGR